MYIGYVVSIVDFKQVNDGWVVTNLTFLYPLKYEKISRFSDISRDRNVKFGTKRLIYQPVKKPV